MCRPDRRRAGRGLAMIEVLVGITLGLLVLVAALAASALTFSTAATGADAAALQQRADLALALIGRQARQAGAVQLDPAGPSVVFRTTFAGWGGSGLSVSGLEGGGDRPDTLRLSRAFVGGERDCLGNEPAVRYLQLVADSIDNEYLIAAEPKNDNRPALYCRGHQNFARQALVSGVDDLQVLYAVAAPAGGLRYVTADAVGLATPVLAVSVCLQLFEVGVQGAGAMTDCHGKPLPAARTAGRMVRLARGVFKVRNALPR
ncbi:hypothetical protein GN316_01800 [Xylophilus sp. Kf1]|nr:hypothetical protein [Xylophilus sp. Kf1]